jgi:hypothetical protein
LTDPVPFRPSPQGQPPPHTSDEDYVATGWDMSDEDDLNLMRRRYGFEWRTRARSQIKRE